MPGRSVCMSNGCGQSLAPLAMPQVPDLPPRLFRHPLPVQPAARFRHAAAAARFPLFTSLLLPYDVIPRKPQHREEMKLASPDRPTHGRGPRLRRGRACTVWSVPSPPLPSLAVLEGNRLMSCSVYRVC